MIDFGDLIIAYNNDVVVGSRPWFGEYTDVPVMGNDGYDDTHGYCEDGDVPKFKIYKQSTNELIDVEPSEPIVYWSNNQIVNINLLEDINTIPNELVLLPAFPNPFNPTTNISFILPKQNHVNLSVFDIRGRKIKDLYIGSLESGTHNIEFNGSVLSSGVYFIQLEANNTVKMQKIVLIK